MSFLHAVQTVIAYGIGLGLVGTIALHGCYRHVRADEPKAAPKIATSDTVVIPTTTFMRGDLNGEPDEYPEQTVTVSGFRIERVEVSNAAYRACVEARACDPGAYLDDTGLGKDDHPVVGVSWEDAERYCRWIGRRLPTEAEWELAARGSDQRHWPWTGRFDAALANTDGPADGHPLTAPVAAFEGGASPHGVLNMAGNAAEWVSDFYDPTYYRTSKDLRDPAGPAKGRERVVRGGSYRDAEYGVRCSSRRARLPTDVDSTVGFRCAEDDASGEVKEKQDGASR